MIIGGTHYNLHTSSQLIFENIPRECCTDKLTVSQMLRVFLKRIDNIEGERENAGHQHFLLYSRCFLKAFFPMVIKTRTVWYGVQD